YLHGLPYAVAPDVQKRVPWITWLSADWQRRSGVHPASLRQQADVRRSHDDWFHSVLGLLDVHTSVYQPEHDIYAACAAG
ncbi:MAG: sulfatase-like hydrolase/transferase, partial [Aquincola tertiaricarbonis]